MFCGYRHLKVDHGKRVYASGKVCINGLEGFWSFAKERLIKHHGVSRSWFPYYLKELEFRYNNRGTIYSMFSVSMCVTLCLLCQIGSNHLNFYKKLFWTSVIHELGGETKISAFIMTLSHSRMWSVVWSRGENMLSWLTCHNRAFEFLGGIPSTVRIDNLKTGVASGCGVWSKINEGYASYARQMDFAPDPHRVRTPRDKGKAERRVQDVKILQVTEKDRFEDMEDLQETSRLRILARSRKLTCPVTGKSIYDSWNLEKQHLKPLPFSLPEPFDVQVSREVGRDCLVSFEGRRYSVPYRWAKRTVQVRGCASTVEFWGEEKLICVFPRKTDCRLLVDQSHYEGTDSDTGKAPAPLGKIGREIVIPRSWEIEDAPRRSIDHYAELVGARS